MRAGGVLLMTLLCAVLTAIPSAPSEAAAGPHIAFVSENELFTADADGSGLRQLPARDPIDISESSWPATGRIVYITRSGISSGSAEWPRERWQMRKIDTAASVDRPITALDLCCQHTVSSIEVTGQEVDLPVVSPDGQKVAFTMRTCAPVYLVVAFSCVWHNQIFVVNTDGSSLKPLAGAILGNEPNWSPDSKHIAFAHRGMIEVVDTTTGVRTRPINPPGTTGRSPRWSPDGTKIAFIGTSAKRILDLGSILIARADGSAVRALPAHTSDPPSWSPDSKYLSYSEATSSRQRNGIMTIRSDGRHRRRLTSYPAYLVEVGSPQWSPDGSRIGFIRADWTDPQPITEMGSLWTIDPKTPFRPRRVATFWDRYPTFAWRSR